MNIYRKYKLQVGSGGWREESSAGGGPGSWGPRAPQRECGQKTGAGGQQPRGSGRGGVLPGRRRWSQARSGVETGGLPGLEGDRLIDQFDSMSEIQIAPPEVCTALICWHSWSLQSMQPAY